jgi:hypothetical protein
MKKRSIICSALIALSLAFIPVLARAQSDATFNNLTVVNSITAPGQITNSDLASAASNTFKCNPSSSAASPTDCSSNAANPLDFGAVANSASAAAANTTAFQNAMAANPVFHCPDGQTFYIGNVTVPSTTTRIYGNCTLIGTGTLASGQGLIDIVNNTNGLVVDGPTISASIAAYPNTVGIRAANSSNVTIRNATVKAAEFGIQALNSTNFNILANTVNSFGNIGIYVSGTSSSGGNIANNYVSGNLLTGSSHCIGVEQGTNYTITGNQVYDCYNFGISVASPLNEAAVTSRVVVASNLINGTRVECINFSNVATGSVTGNTCIFNGKSEDFGMSFFGTPGTFPQAIVQDINVSGNTIAGPCKAGIALADVVFRLNVVGNYIYNPDTCGGSTADYQSGVLLYGGSNSQNHVADNLVIDTGGHMAWQIGEGTYNDGTGNPNGNFLQGAAGTVGTSGQIFAAGSATQVVNAMNAWIPYTSTLTCGSGAPGSQSVTGLYKQMGKTVQVQINATLAAVGTCASSISASLPFTAASSGVLSGREATNTGVTLSGIVSSSTAKVQIVTYSNAAHIAAGDSYILSGSYQRQ